MSEWKYTAAEKKIIDSAYTAVEYVSDLVGMDLMLRDAYRYERKERSSATATKAMLIDSFKTGAKENPSASTLAFWSGGAARAAMIGAKADYRARGCEFRKWPELEDALAKADLAAKAHRAYIARGLGKAARGEEVK